MDGFVHAQFPRVSSEDSSVKVPAYLMLAGERKLGHVVERTQNGSLAGANIAMQSELRSGLGIRQIMSIAVAGSADL